MAGLFDFVKTIGKKIFGEGDPDAAAKIKAEIEKDNPGVKDLGEKFNDGKVELTGSGSAEALQKAILIAGNAMGVAEVKVAGAAVSSVDDGTQYYIIKSGDTLLGNRQAVLRRCQPVPEDFRREPRGHQGCEPDLSRSEDPHSQGMRPQIRSSWSVTCQNGIDAEVSGRRANGARRRVPVRCYPLQGHRPGARLRQLSLPVLPQGVVGARAALCAVCALALRDHARLAGAIPFLRRGHAQLLPTLRVAAHLSPCWPSRPVGHHDLQPRRSGRAAAGLSRMDAATSPAGR